MSTETRPSRQGRLRPRWYLELAVIGAFYGIYSWVRNQFGSAAVSPSEAQANAELVIDWERSIGLYFERDLQDLFIGWVSFIQFWNLFYGLFHFAVTAITLIWLYYRFPRHYPFWRTTGLLTTGSALVGFALFPLMPPRLLSVGGTYGGDLPDTGYVDTVADLGGLWSFTSGAAEQLSNQYAAMPSLHFAWSLWCFLALRKHLTNPVAKWSLAAYPWLTLFAIVVTANHYWIDAVGGLGALGVGWAAAKGYHRLRDRR
ncbi:phosphatase PAP2 family protein [Candidatus Poriferisocius sp.]|uniref:phosphatase PAP2 family protein n=1 Tax=Candidatus Poriferisocius sp. TaxID=3101276 RepID=UPI003B58C216